MTNKIVKHEGVIHITPDGKIASIKFSDWDLPRGSRSVGGHIDVNDEPLKNKDEIKEDRGFIPRNS